MNNLENLRNQLAFPPHASAKYVWEELMNRGWTIRVLRSDAEKLYTLTLAERGDQKFFVSEVQHQLYTPLNDRQSYFITANKSRTQCALDDIGLHYPKNLFEINHANIASIDNFEVKTKIVVKPHASHGGQGVRIISTTEELLPAVEHALTFSEYAIIQEFAEGEEYRLLMIDGQFVASFRSRPACVRGDGHMTVAKLIEAKNQRKSSFEYQGTRSKIKLDRAQEFMGTKGLDWVPERDELVILDSISNISFGGDAIDATDQVSRILREKVGELCRMASLGVVGVDVISPDIQSDDLTIHKITEINGSPGLRPHVLVEEGTPRNVAVPYVDALEKYVDLRYNPERKALPH